MVDADRRLASRAGQRKPVAVAADQLLRKRARARRLDVASGHRNGAVLAEQFEADFIVEWDTISVGYDELHVDQLATAHDEWLHADVVGFVPKAGADPSRLIRGELALKP